MSKSYSDRVRPGWRTAKLNNLARASHETREMSQKCLHGVDGGPAIRWKSRKRTYVRKPAVVGVLQHFGREQPQAALEVDEDKSRVDDVEEVEDGEGQDCEQLLP